MSQLDQQLEEMRRAHCATARYTVYLKPANFVKGRTVLETGLTWDVANQKRDRQQQRAMEANLGMKIIRTGHHTSIWVPA